MPPIVSKQDQNTIAQRVLLNPNAGDTLRNAVALLLRRSGYRNLVRDLKSVLDNPAEKARFRSFAVQHLYMALDGADFGLIDIIHETLLKCLEDKDVPVRREALLALARLKNPKADEVMREWLIRPDADDVRDLAIRCIRESNKREYIDEIRKYVESTNATIRIAAIVTLAEWNDEVSRPAFERAAASSVERIKRAGIAALARLNQD